MADRNPTTPGTPGPSKAIASLAKKPTDTTRSGAQKLKFVPTLPARRKKDEVKQEPAAPIVPTTPALDRGGRGRGRGRGRGTDSPRGRGRGAAPPRPPPVEMTASGPFAMGPAGAGSSGWRSAPRAGAAPIVPLGPGGSSSLGTNLTKSAAPSLKKERVARDPQKDEHADEDVEVYSDPDEGVEIVDMQDVRAMDWMAPESLRKEKERDKKKKKVKREEDDVKPGVKAEIEAMDVGEGTPIPDGGDVNLANAVDLSESEDEEEMEDLIDDFAAASVEPDDSPDLHHERLFIFQFPDPFPTFVPKDTSGDVKGKGKASETAPKRVSFTQDTKPAVNVAGEGDADKETEEQFVDGIIGQLEVHQSGAVKMRLANGILMEVAAATQPSFLQQAVHVDHTQKRLHVLGEVSRRFVVTPDLDTLLDAMNRADQPQPTVLDDPSLIPMDTT
ncbi:RNA polymerase III RPC4-domain-containing protein [Amylostereum chailletii]|nr:RNA polymerase III RPC4-domain-containing protein [Amylostereum chailletii]